MTISTFYSVIFGGNFERFDIWIDTAVAVVLPSRLAGIIQFSGHAA